MKLPPGVSVRHAKHSDAEKIARIARESHAAAMPWLPVPHGAEGDLSHCRRRVLPEQIVDVAEVDGSVRGFVAYRGDWVNHLYITPGAWRQRLGSRLLCRAMDGRRYLQVWDLERNAGAQAFYRRHGFVVAERTDGANNEEKCPDIRMTWAN